MTNSNSRDERILRTSAGEFPLDEYRLKSGEREWKILHVSAVLSWREESHFLREKREVVPYGVTLWASAVALAHEIASRENEFRGKSVLELGAGTGLPGIVAASSGARKIVQTDRSELAVSVCQRNIRLNKTAGIEQRLVDWTDWKDAAEYDWIVGSDILYDKEMHQHLRAIFEANLSTGGRILLSDPFREPSLKLLEDLETAGWLVSMSKWSVNVGSDGSDESSTPRPVGVFELRRPDL